MRADKLWEGMSTAQARPASARDFRKDVALELSLPTVAACSVYSAIAGSQKKALNSGNAPLTNRS